jgi:hypothetical protein
VFDVLLSEDGGTVRDVWSFLTNGIGARDDENGSESDAREMGGASDCNVRS